MYSGPLLFCRNKIKEGLVESRTVMQIVTNIFLTKKHESEE